MSIYSGKHPHEEFGMITLKQV